MISLPRFFWLVVPFLFLLMQIGIEIFVPHQYMDNLHSEGGPHEAFEALFLIIGVLIAARLVMIAPTKWLKIWAGLALLGCFYTAGEELSWGQHLFGWGTPEYWSQVNDQRETNLHNTSSWLDQKPRLILEIGVIVAGLIIPALQRWRPEKVPQKFADIYGIPQLAVIAGFFAMIKLTETVLNAMDSRLFWRASEVEEVYIFYFVMLYLVVLYQRFKSKVAHSS